MIKAILVLSLTIFALNLTISAAHAAPTDEPPPPASNENPAVLPGAPAVGQNLVGQVADLNIGSHPAAPAAVAPSGQGKQVIATTDGDWPDVTAEIFELKRTGGDTLTLKFAINNASSEDLSFSYDFGTGTNDFNTIGAVNLLDPVNKKKYFVVRDSKGTCVCSTGQKSITPGAKRNLWAKFPAPPANVSKITIEIPHFIPVEDVPIS